jgi:hypothetical protein
MNKPTGRSYLQKMIKLLQEHGIAGTHQSRRSKAHRTTNIHRITMLIEGEALDAGTHRESGMSDA